MDERQLDLLFAEVSRHFARRSGEVDTAIEEGEASEIVTHQQTILLRESLLMQRLQGEIALGIYQELVAMRQQRTT